MIQCQCQCQYQYINHFNDELDVIREKKTYEQNPLNGPDDLVTAIRPLSEIVINQGTIWNHFSITFIL